MSQTPSRTTAAGIPVAVNQNSLSAGPRGPLRLQDFQPFEKLKHFNPERILERVVHAKGSGAHGTFTVMHDIAKYTKAKRFAAIGKKADPARGAAVARKLAPMGAMDPEVAKAFSLVKAG